MWSPVSGALHGYESYDYLYSKKPQSEESSRADRRLCGTLWKLGEAPEVILRSSVHERDPGEWCSAQLTHTISNSVYKGRVGIGSILNNDISHFSLVTF